MDFSLLGAFIGGIGLFLLGMRMMTDGLKLAAGNALRSILTMGTRTSLRGLLSGALITSLVQSSSAVTVAVIGFVNAGLLTLTQTIFVIYGSNIGTTMTGWLVALVGFSFDIKVLALPLIGFGMLLRLVGRSSRRDAIGEALVGFGLFFLGIDVLKESFSGLGSSFDITSLESHGMLGVLSFVGIGFLLTFLMQSSSAAMAITLTAAATGVVPIDAAAATVIGANVGTTSTAALAVIGATPNAQRTAAAHVLFNLLTGLVALLLLQPLLQVVDQLNVWLSEGQGVAATLALFHTLFNILGVLLLWPLTARMVAFLERRFVVPADELGRPHYLDKNVLTLPSLAFSAVVMEIARIGGHAREMAMTALSTESVVSRQLAVDKEVLKRLESAVSDFSVQMQQSNLPKEIGDALPDALRTSRYFHAAASLAEDAALMQTEIEHIEDSHLAETIAEYRHEVSKIFESADPLLPDFDRAYVEQQLDGLEPHYQNVKALLLRAGAQNLIRVRQMVKLLDQLSLIHRMTRQLAKGVIYLDNLWLLARHRTEEDKGAEELPGGEESEPPEERE